MRIRPVILCGGNGTRLWPLSRSSMPKQFVPVQGEHTPLQETIRRIQGEQYLDPIIVTSEAMRFFAAADLAALGVQATLLLEPVGRDSGPAVIASAVYASGLSKDELILILAADHKIGDEAAFHAAIAAGAQAAANQMIVTFGLEPAHASTAYGYIDPGEEIMRDVFNVHRFHEKPIESDASRYVSNGMLWNSGNFLARPETFIEEFKVRHSNSLSLIRKAVASGRTSSGAVTLESNAYAAVEPISIDYAVMEHTKRAVVVPSAWQWSDIGTWDEVWSVSEKDGNGNVTVGGANAVDSRNCYVRANGPITSVLGAQDLIVVVEPDAVLVADRKNAAGVKALVEDLVHRGVPQATQHERVHRPWGWYEVRDHGTAFQVKRIAVNPGGRLSLQRHHFRSEHWVVVTGEAKVTVADTVRVLGPNEHVSIPLGAVHRLENPGEEMLEVVEVQYGTYLGEDDIVRIEDIYDREVEVEDASA